MTISDHWQLDDTFTFLNHGSFGACPRVVMEAQARLRAHLEAQPVRFYMRELEGLLDAVRIELAALFRAEPLDLVFVPNASYGCNAVLSSLEFRAGDEILITNHGYNAVNNAAARWGNPRGATVTVAKIPFPIASPDDAVQAVFEAVTPRTRLLIIDQITSPTALVLPTREICARAATLGIQTLVDAAHAPGMLPLDLSALGADYVTGNLHKWVCAPKGAGFLWVQRDLQERIHPPVTSHGANAKRTDRSRFMLEFDWTGTSDPTAIAVVPRALEFLRGLSGGSLDAHMAENHALALKARKYVAERLGVELPAPDSMIGSMAVIPLPDRPKDELPGKPTFPAAVDPLHDRLADKHLVEVPIMNWPTPEKRWVRISAQRYNTMSDYERLCDALIKETTSPSA